MEAESITYRYFEFLVFSSLASKPNINTKCQGPFHNFSFWFKTNSSKVTSEQVSVYWWPLERQRWEVTKVRIWLYFVVCLVFCLFVFKSIKPTHVVYFVWAAFPSSCIMPKWVGFPGPLALFPVGSFYPGSLGAPMEASGSEGEASF